MKKTPYVYCICRIDLKLWKTIGQSIKDRGYKNIKPFIPVVKLLKKSRDGKQFYEDIPLFFKYGFIRMKSERAFDRNFLIKLKKDIPGIVAWVKSPEPLFPKRKKRRIDNAEDFDDFSIVATVSKKEIKYYKEQEKRNNVFSAKDITSIHIGDYITLRGYPFDGIGAEVDNIDLVNKAITVTLYPGQVNNLTVKLPMDNVLYSVYMDYDEDDLLANKTTKDIEKL